LRLGLVAADRPTVRRVLQALPDVEVVELGPFDRGADLRLVDPADARASTWMAMWRALSWPCGLLSDDLGAVRQLARPEAPGSAGTTLHLADGMVLLDRAIAQRGGAEQPLTAQEVAILQFLAARSPAVVSREELLQQVWGYRRSLDTRSVDLAISRLRRKIESDPAHPRHLSTVFGLGYRFTERERAASPSAVHRLLGRHGVWRSLLARLHRPGLVTLCGPGGVGKSALAAALAEVEGHRRSVHRVDAARLEGLAEQLGPHEGALVVLDGVSPTAALRRSSPGATWLVTSLAATGLPGEELVRLGGLEPSDGARLLADVADDDTADSLPMRLAISQRLGGVPLALRLAGNRAGVVGWAGVHADLADPRRILAWEAPAEEERHRSLGRLHTAEVAALPEPARRVLEAACAFGPAFAEPELRSALPDGAPGRELGPLTEAGLLVRVDADSWGVAPLVGASVEVSDALTLAVAAAVEHHAAEALAALPGGGADERRRGRRLRDQLLHLADQPSVDRARAAVTAARLNRLADGAPLRRAELLDGADGEVAAERAFVRAAMGDLEGAADAVQAALAGPLPPALRLELLPLEVDLLIRRGEAARALELAHQHLTEASEPGPEGRLWDRAACANRRLGLLDAARRASERAVGCLLAAGERWSAAEALANRGLADFLEDRAEAAEAAWVAAANTFRQLGAEPDPTLFANLARAALELGDLAACAERSDLALHAATRAGATYAQISARLIRGRLALRRGDRTAARAELRSAESVARRAGFVREWGLATALLGWCEHEAGDLLRAGQAYDRAMGLLGEMGLAVMPALWAWSTLLGRNSAPLRARSDPAARALVRLLDEPVEPGSGGDRWLTWRLIVGVGGRYRSGPA
jgi:DNA-binding winged helix-turn-helix (wHTH) protein/tetratricopeptide (TPR) repeat protein